MNELEPIACLLYAVAIYFEYALHKLSRYKVLFVYHVLAAVILYTGIKLPVDNNWSYNLLFIINIGVFSWYFLQLLETRTRRIITITCFIVNLLLFIYYDIILARFFSDFNSMVYGVTFLSILLYCLFYLHQLLVVGREENLLLNFDFWLVCGYLLYFLGSFVIIVYYEKATSVMRGNMWILHNIVLLVCALIMLPAHFSISKKIKKLNG